MGTEYYFVNKENKTFYDLGKGGWYELADEISAVTDAEYLEEFIYDNVFDFYHPPEDLDNRRFCKELSNDLILFVNGADTKNLFIVDDCGDDSIIFKGLGYRCVGNRYVKKSEPEKLDNRHLEESYRHLYGIEKLINKRIYTAVGNKYVPLIQNHEIPYITLIKKYGGEVSQDTSGKYIVTN